jgi:hypothetical protein
VDNVERLLVREGGTVRARRGDRVERIRDGDDARAERDTSAAQPSRVAGAVEALVMMANHGRELGVAQLSDHRGAVLGMSLHDFELGIGEPPPLLKYLRRSVELSDVVNQRRRFDARQFLAKLPHPLSDSRGMMGHPTRMPAEVDILVVQSRGEPLEQLRPRFNVCRGRPQRV